MFTESHSMHLEKRGDLDIFSEKSSNCSYLENVGHVPKVEDVMELDCCWQESCCHLCLESQGSVDEGATVFLDPLGEARHGQMLLQDAGVNGGQGLGIGEVDGEDTEVTLQEDTKYCITESCNSIYFYLKVLYDL